MPSLYCTGWSQWPLQRHLKTESADGYKFWLYVLRVKIGQRHSYDLIDLTIIDENIKIGNDRSDFVCRSVIEPDPAATPGVELELIRRESGPCSRSGNWFKPVTLTFLSRQFVKGADTRAFCKKLSISGVHHSPRVDVRRCRRFLWRYFLFSPAQALDAV